MKNIILLGGSNSILKFGLSHGLRCDKKYNLALGATSSIQNIHAVSINKELVQSSDAIVTESNVNDIYNVCASGYPLEIILENIDLLYEELYGIGKYVVVIIFPVFVYESKSLSSEVIDIVNTRHRQLASKYGFSLIDLQSALCIENLGVDDVKLLQPDSLHISESIAYTLGSQIRNYIESVDVSCDFGTSLESNFFAVSEFTNDSFVKDNSRFSRKCYHIDDISITTDAEYTCVGIETWSDANSLLFIRTESKHFYKYFSRNLAFNELINTTSGTIYLKSVAYSQYDEYEPSVNVVLGATGVDRTTVSSLLFRKMKFHVSDIDIGGWVNLNFLIPDFNPFLRSIKQANLLACKSTDVDVIRDSALLLEKININYSYHLMLIASRIRPNGPLIVKKLDEYKEYLKSR